jgi:hypothetical protein
VSTLFDKLLCSSVRLACLFAIKLALPHSIAERKNYANIPFEEQLMKPKAQLLFNYFKKNPIVIGKIKILIFFVLQFWEYIFRTLSVGVECLVINLKM